MMPFHYMCLLWVLGPVVAQDLFEKGNTFLAQRGLTMQTVNPSETNLTAQVSVKSADTWYKNIGPGDGSFNLCVDLPGGDAFNGNRLWLWECNGKNSQIWVFDNFQIRYGMDENFCIDASDQSNGVQLWLWECNGNEQQTWAYGDDGMVYISGGSFSTCLDHFEGNYDNGQALHVWECSYADNQKWGLFDSDPPNFFPVWPEDNCQYDTGVWPWFQTQQDLENDQWWSAYFTTVYGAIPTWGYPICPGAFQFLWQSAARDSGVALQPTDCAPNAAPTWKGEGDELSDGEYYINNAFLDAQQAFGFIYNSRLWGASVPRNNWVEVAHTVFSGDTGAVWYYMAVGSGVWFNVGNTAVYTDHADAMRDILGSGCVDQDWNTFADWEPVSSIGPTECEKSFDDLWPVAISRGFDSFQFTDHYDCTCGPQGDSSYKYDRRCPTEIVALQDKGGATEACSSLLRGGWGAGTDCNCDPNFISTTKDVDKSTGLTLSAGYSNCGAN